MGTFLVQLNYIPPKSTNRRDLPRMRATHIINSISRNLPPGQNGICRGNGVETNTSWRNYHNQSWQEQHYHPPRPAARLSAAPYTGTKPLTAYSSSYKKNIRRPRHASPGLNLGTIPGDHPQSLRAISRFPSKATTNMNGSSGSSLV